MPNRLPPEFDPDRYAAAYPDVALSGLEPAEHYLRFGKLLGRSPTGKGVAPKPVSPPAHPKAPSPAAGTSAAPPKEPKPPRAEPEPIIARPADLDPAKLAALPAPPRAGASEDGTFDLRTLSEGPFQTPEHGNDLCRPLMAYASIFDLEPPCPLPERADFVLSGSRQFLSGALRIENTWFADGRLRLMIAGAAESPNESQGWALRAYQAGARTPCELRLAGAGLQFPGAGPIFHDLELVHPLMPLLLELADTSGATREIALLPFPSLLPGGLHAAELRALQEDANPMDAFWSLSEALLSELLETKSSSKRSITTLAIATNGAEKEITSEVEDWLSSVFGLLASDANGGLRLRLPTDAVPTISALVSRRLDVDGVHSVAGPYLVADPSTRQPRWSVALPSGQAAAPGIPLLERPGRSGRCKTGSSKPVPVHLAIVFRPSPSAEMLPLEGERESAKLPPLTVSVDSRDPERTQKLVSVLEDDTEIDLVPREPNSDLRNIARTAKHDLILTLDDRIRLTDTGSVAALCRLIQADDSIASASCVLLGEAVFKKQSVLRPASGGLFPGRVSFASSPRLSFFEPDVLQPLAQLTYPVVANTFLFTIWRRSALAALPSREGPNSKSSADIRLGLDLMQAGYRNICTAEATAVLSGPYTRRDVIDPVGSAYLQPARWEDLLNRVTILRELF